MDIYKKKSDICERYNGYMTLEAAFIVPWVVFMLVWLIYLGYFEYDRCLLFQDDYTLATQTATRICTNDEQQNWLNGHMNTQLGHKYMGGSHVEISGKVESSRIKVESRTRVAHPLSFHAGFIPTGNWNISDVVNADNYSFTQRLRTYRTVGRVLNSVK